MTTKRWRGGSAIRCFAPTVIAALLATAAFSQDLDSSADPARTTVPDRGFVLGKVYELDPEAYRLHEDRMRREGSREDASLDPDSLEYLIELGDVTVTAKQLASNQRFTSSFSDINGDYLIRNVPAGAFDFSLMHDALEYPVQQRLDLNVELAFVAELCFVIDRQNQVAWMVVAGERRTAEVPSWVPRTCRSVLTECLAMFAPTGETMPDGLLLLLAGSGAAATGIGVIPATQQSEASPLRTP